MIPGLLTWGSMLVNLASSLAKTDDAKEEFKTASNALGWASNIHNATKTGSIQSSAARSLISPMIVFEESLMHLDYMQDLITIINLRDIKDALTHLSLESSVGKVKISQLVNQINPNRSAGYMSLAGSEAFANASGLKMPKADDPDEKKKKQKNTDGNVQIGIDSSDMRNLTEYTPLALGKTVRATSVVDGVEVGFFLTFRPIPVAASTNDLELMFQAAKKGEGWRARFKDYYAGGITRPELLKGTDVIKREFNIANRELSGYYAEAQRRERGNLKESLRTGYISMNDMANVVILSKDTADNIELELGVRFNSPSIKILRKAMKANTIVIVNDARGIFEFYTVGDPIPVKYTLSQIRQKSKKDDTDSLESLIKLLSGR